MQARWVGCLVLFGLLMSPACSRIHEPWVPSADYLKQERRLTPAMERRLQIRLAENQRDR